MPDSFGQSRIALRRSLALGILGSEGSASSDGWESGSSAARALCAKGRMDSTELFRLLSKHHGPGKAIHRRDQGADAARPEPLFSRISIEELRGESGGSIEGGGIRLREFHLALHQYPFEVTCGAAPISSQTRCSGRTRALAAQLEAGGMRISRYLRGAGEV